MRLELTTYRLTAGRATDCAIQELRKVLDSDWYVSPYGPMDKAPAYGAGDSGFESRYGLLFCFCPFTKNNNQQKKSTSGEDRTHANKVDQNLSLAP